MHLYRKYIKQGLAFLLLLLIVCSCVPNVHATEDSESQTEDSKDDEKEEKEEEHKHVARRATNII